MKHNVCRLTGAFVLDSSPQNCRSADHLLMTSVILFINPIYCILHFFQRITDCLTLAEQTLGPLVMSNLIETFENSK